jgi:hypothetical protein
MLRPETDAARVKRRLRWEIFRGQDHIGEPMPLPASPSIAEHARHLLKIVGPGTAECVPYDVGL